MKMFRQHLPYFVLISILAVAAMVLRFAGDVGISDGIVIKQGLPDLLGEWCGENVFFCQNEECMKSFVAGELNGATVCKSCGLPLVQSWSLGEVNLLPPDTILLKKEYRNKSGVTMVVAVVVAGSEITSIHRPQMCLVGQGHRIVAQKTAVIPLNGRGPLSVKVLDLLFQDASKEQFSVYTYWYTDGVRETSGNFARSFYMFVDRVLFARSSRWAYISIATSGSDATKKEIVSFVQALYPAIAGGKRY